jgi:polyvinyl alcohol dehydrogenase (cytochrome)
MTVPGFAGASVWGSMAPIDRARNQVIVATSNNHHRPEVVDACLRSLGPLTHANIAEQIACENLAGGENNWRESIVAMDLDSGKINWAQRVGAPDAWNGGCFAGDGSNPNCPNPEGPDYAFGQAPMLVTACRQGRGCKQLAIVGQKSGIVWAVRVDTGVIEWHTQVGPGGLIGGMMWGSASDNERVYVANNNFFHKPLTDLFPDAGANAPTGGVAAALDSWDGKVVWAFANPEPQAGDASLNALSQAPMTVAGGVVFYPSMDAKGYIFYLEAKTGRRLGAHATGATNACGPSIVNGTVYSGTGYLAFGLGSLGKQVTALAIP